MENFLGFDDLQQLDAQNPGGLIARLMNRMTQMRDEVRQLAATHGMQEDEQLGEFEATIGRLMNPGNIFAPATPAVPPVFYQEVFYGQSEEIPAPPGVDPDRWAGRLAPEHPYWTLPAWAMVSLTPGWKEGEVLVASVEALIRQDEFLPQESCQLKVFAALESIRKVNNLSLAELLLMARICEVDLSGVKLRPSRRATGFAQPRQQELASFLMLQRHFTGSAEDYDPRRCPLSVLKIPLRRMGLPSSLVHFAPRLDIVRAARGEEVEFTPDTRNRQARYDSLPRARQDIALLLRLQGIEKIANLKEGKISLASREAHWVEPVLASREQSALVAALLRVGAVPPPNVTPEVYFNANFHIYALAGFSSEDSPSSLNLSYLTQPYPFSQEKAAALTAARVKPWVKMERAVMAGELPVEPVMRRRVRKINPEREFSEDAIFILCVYYHVLKHRAFPQEGQNMSSLRAVLLLEKVPDRQLLQLGVTAYKSRQELVKNTAKLLFEPGFFLPAWRSLVHKSEEGKFQSWKDLSGVFDSLSALRLGHQKYCRNQKSETCSWNSIFDRELFLVAFGTLQDYHMFELEEIQKAAYCDENGITSFRRPDDPVNKNIPLSQIRKLRDMVSLSERGVPEWLPPHHDQWWLGAVGDVEAATFLPWCEETLAKMQDRIDFDDEALARFRVLTSEQQDSVANALREIFYLGMYFRRWKGPGHAYPLKKNETSPELGEELPENINEHTERVRKLLETETKEVQDFLNSLLIVSYNRDGTLDLLSSQTFGNLWRQILKEDACIRMASIALVGTGYHFLDVLKGEKIPGIEVKEMDKIQ